jgi:hypothetical protein
MFRAKYLEGLAGLLQRGELDVPPQLVALREKHRRRRLLRQWKKKPWVVYSKPPFAGPEKLLGYLSRYTHRVAISNHRLLRCEDGQVTFSYRDRQVCDRGKSATIPADEFIHRFLNHVLPDRFMRIRHYGLLANRGKRERLALCRQLLGGREPTEHDDSPKTAAEWMTHLFGIDIGRCPCCGEVLYREFIAPIIPPSKQPPKKPTATGLTAAHPP